MGMTTVLTLAYEGPPACINCTREGIPVCDHIGFTAEAWDHMTGQAVRAPGLDPGIDFRHTLRSVEIGPNRKTVTLTVDTERPRFADLSRHLSSYADPRAKAWIRAVHHQTGEALEEGHYDAFHRVDEQVCIDRDLYRVAKVEHPNRNEHGIAEAGDLQVIHLEPVPVDPAMVTPVDT